MEEALIQVGLPVKCRMCETKGFVKPCTDYGGWYKSRLFRFKRLKWFCPEHADEGRKEDQRWYENTKTPEPKLDPVAKTEATTDELYALLD